MRKGRTASLNIKNPEARRLAADISQTTGETMTQVVVQALRESHKRYNKRRAKATVEELLAIAQRISSRVKRPYVGHAELLYDEQGLPK
jgi:antitoxin VapB